AAAAVGGHDDQIDVGLASSFEDHFDDVALLRHLVPRPSGDFGRDNPSAATPGAIEIIAPSVAQSPAPSIPGASGRQLPADKKTKCRGSRKRREAGRLRSSWFRRRR